MNWIVSFLLIFIFIVSYFSVQVEQDGDIPPTCCNFALTVCDDHMYVFSGQSGARITNHLYQFNFNTRVWVLISIVHPILFYFTSHHLHGRGENCFEFQATIVILSSCYGTMIMLNYYYVINISTWAQYSRVIFHWILDDLVFEIHLNMFCYHNSPFIIELALKRNCFVNRLRITCHPPEGRRLSPQLFL